MHDRDLAGDGGIANLLVQVDVGLVAVAGLQGDGGVRRSSGFALHQVLLVAFAVDGGDDGEYLTCVISGARFGIEGGIGIVVFIAPGHFAGSGIDLAGPGAEVVDHFVGGGVGIVRVGVIDVDFVLTVGGVRDHGDGAGSAGRGIGVALVG